MFDIETELNRWRCQMNRRRNLSPEILEELESHLCDTYETNTAYMPEEQAFQVALDSLGKSDVLSNEFRKIDPLISVENRMKNLIFGSVIVITGLFAAMVLAGIDPLIYFHLTELIAVFSGSLGITVSTVGFSRLREAVQCVFGRKHCSEATIIVLKRWISATYASGGLVLLLCLAHCFNYLNDPVVFGGKVSASFTALIYAVSISELFLRPTLSKLLEQVEFCEI